MGHRRGKRRLKSLLGHLMYRTGMYRRLWRDRALIVLFHRVDDRYPEDPITCSRAHFSACCDFFSRYFEVVSLGELLALQRRGADISRRLVITFDDGYSDNYHYAAAELRRRGLPASFFIPTAFVGTDHTAWWDAESSIRSEWVTWDEVRALHAEGFELGSHTLTHADCGRISGAEAVREIAGSKAELEAEVGARIQHFAFPYGDATRMTEENRRIVKDAGYATCLAAHGGVVRPWDNPFRLNRIPINMWYTSPYQFGFEAIQVLQRDDSLEGAANVEREPAPAHHESRLR
jgi:peptidoglycan/xylan/chitin deacetylase (PgdA/CDA1 family)